MSPDESICGLMLVYVAGCADDDEVARAELLLCDGTPMAVAAYAEAVAVFHHLPTTLTHVPPPQHCCDHLFGRVTANLSQDLSTSASSAFVSPVGQSPFRTSGQAAPRSAVARLRWPIYVASGLAACLAVALTVSIMDNRRLESRNARMADTLAESQTVLRSSHVSLASLTSGGPAGPVGDDTTNHTFGRVLFCPVTKHYMVSVFNLQSLPPGRAYELWLITPKGRKVPAGVFKVDDRGSATVPAVPVQAVDDVALAAVTEEPAGGSDQPTTTPVLAGPLEATP